MHTAALSCVFRCGVMKNLQLALQDLNHSTVKTHDTAVPLAVLLALPRQLTTMTCHHHHDPASSRPSINTTQHQSHTGKHLGTHLGANMGRHLRSA